MFHIKHTFSLSMKDAKDFNTVKLWRRLPMMTSSNSSSPNKKSEGSSQDEISMIKLKKVC